MTLKSAVQAIGADFKIGRIKREAAALSPAEIERRIEAAAAKTLVFAVSSGRAGTATLARLFTEIPAIHSIHEGRPAFQDVMRKAIADPLLTRDFLLTRKLPAIAAAGEPVYFESSHLFGKGFLTPTLRLGLKPRILFLKRDPRKVALSFERIGATPVRTPGGREHLISPADPSLLPAVRWDDFTDYQLCYWYALETIRRQRVLHDLAARAGCRCRYLRIEDLSSVADVRALLASLDINVPIEPDTAARLEAIVGQAFNLKTKRAPLDRPAAELDAQEALVIDRIQACLPEVNIRAMVAGYLNGVSHVPEPARPAPAALREEPRSFLEILGAEPRLDRAPSSRLSSQRDRVAAS